MTDLADEIRRILAELDRDPAGDGDEASPSVELPEATVREAFNRLTLQHESPAEIAQALEIDFGDLILALTDRAHLRKFLGAILLNRMHRQFLFDRFRVGAMATLHEIATAEPDDDKEPSAGAARALETKRKACVDLLRGEPKPPGAQRAHSAPRRSQAEQLNEDERRELKRYRTYERWWRKLASTTLEGLSEIGRHNREKEEAEIAAINARMKKQNIEELVRRAREQRKNARGANAYSANAPNTNEENVGGKVFRGNANRQPSADPPAPRRGEAHPRDRPR